MNNRIKKKRDSLLVRQRTHGMVPCMKQALRAIYGDDYTNNRRLRARWKVIPRNDKLMAILYTSAYCTLCKFVPPFLISPTLPKRLYSTNRTVSNDTKNVRTITLKAKDLELY